MKEEEKGFAAWRQRRRRGGRRRNQCARTPRTPWQGETALSPPGVMGKRSIALTVIGGQIEGHYILPSQNKTTK